MRYCILTVLAAVLLIVGSCAESQDEQVQICSREKDQEIKVAVVTGGHDFEKEEFLGLFTGHKDIEYVHVPQSDHSEIFEDISQWPYDVIVLYNMTQQISPRRRANFVKLLENEVGLVVLHHSILAFQGWGEYKKIAGGRLYLEDTVEDGVEGRKLEFKHNVNFTIHIEDKEHPITRGLSDFTVYDETYKHGVIEPGNRVLLTTNEPTSDRIIGWVSGYDKGKVCFIESGHGTAIYSDANFRRLTAQAIRWCAGQL
ncbi:MAG: ThuA domain-containing protein [Planctomycetota bacterium]|jgi:type 1 glutamine amidotransferase